MNEMVDRVARAISIAMDETSQSYCEMVARAAIDAMREPTVKMAGAAFDTGIKLSLNDVEKIYGDMIDAALTNGE